MAVRIVKCTNEAAKEVFPQVRHWLDACMKVAPPWWQTDDLYVKCLHGDYVMWLVLVNEKMAGVALSDLAQFPSAMVCNVPWIGGRGMKIWLPTLQATIEQWARDAGAKYLSGSGRRGWARVSDMKEFGTNLVKEL